MKTALTILQIIFSVLLIAAVLLQQRGSGLGSAFGGGGGITSGRRGVDKILFQVTIAISILFFATAVANLII